mgnify:FL=1|jgi:hypothetical protein|tara:strand:- start:1515 stop:2291 length:777 start_codon:yes stop_codon:yes gene_type:complete
MKLGIAYNLFDGEELLEDSIKSIRENVDYITVIYQNISNFGHKSKSDLLTLLTQLKEQNLVDNLIEYKPQVNVGGHQNEMVKRNLGLYDCKRNNCTHFMSMDSDELYDKEQFKMVKDIMVNEEYDSSSCQLVTYYKSGEYRLDPKEDYYVSLIFKIRPGIEFVFGHPFPVMVDPTRRMLPGKCKVFTREEIEMHHFSYVRKDLNIKLTNSSASPNFKNINKIVTYFNDWKPGKQALMGGAPDKFYNTVKVENKFNIKI